MNVHSRNKTTSEFSVGGKRKAGFLADGEREDSNAVASAAARLTKHKKRVVFITSIPWDQRVGRQVCGISYTK